MTRFANVHRGQRAAVILGGPSLVAHRFDFSRLRGRGFVTFVEGKALTPGLLDSGFVPDYYLMLFPEKAKDNALQTFVFRSFLAGCRIDGFLRPEYRPVAESMRQKFDEYFEAGRPERGMHKRLRWRPSVYLPDSPYELLRRIPETRVIANRALTDKYFPDFAYADRALYFSDRSESPAFDIDRYFHPVEHDGILTLHGAAHFYNAAAIALYPLLSAFGFGEVYFFGMDMSLLGSLEYAAPYTFRSMAHFWWFFRRIRRAFSATYNGNGLFFKRPQSEFDDLRMLWRDAPLTFSRVYDPWRYATPVDGIRTISTDAFWRL